MIGVTNTYCKECGYYYKHADDCSKQVLEKLYWRQNDRGLWYTVLTKEPLPTDKPFEYFNNAPSKPLP